jgi:outer membrane protein
MKTMFLSLCAFAQAGAFAAPQAFAQRFGYADSQYILEQMPEYQNAQKEIEQMSQQWQQEVEAAYKKIEQMYQDYRAREVLLSKDDKQRMQDEIMQEEKKAKELQRQHFGVEGDLFKMRQEKMKPIQDRLIQTIETVAKEKKAEMVFDKSGSMILLYSDPKFDYTKDVLQKLGVTPK